MKYEDGKVVLEEGEKRLGNFFIKSENGAIVMADLNSKVNVSISEDIASGMLLKMAMENPDAEEFLEVYMKSFYNLFSVVADPDFLIDVNNAARKCAERNRKVFGMTEEVDPEKDRELIEHQKALHNDLEELTKGLKTN